MARIAKVRAGILVFVMLAGLPAIGDLPFDRSAEAAEPDQPIAITQSPLQLPNPFAESAGHEQYSVDVLTNIDQNRDQPQPGPLAIVPVESPYAPDASIPFMMINPGSNQHRKTRPQGAKSGTTTHIASLSKNITSDHRVNLDYKPDMPRSYLATCLSAIDPIGAGAAAGATALGVTAAAPEAPATTAVVLPEVDVTATAPDCQLRIKEHRQDTRESFRDLTSNALYVWTKIDDSGAFIGTEVAYTLDQSFSIGADVQHLTTVGGSSGGELQQFGRFHADRSIVIKYSEGLLFVRRLTDYRAVVSQVRYNPIDGSLLGIISIQQVF